MLNFTKTFQFPFYNRPSDFKFVFGSLFPSHKIKVLTKASFQLKRQCCTSNHKKWLNALKF